MPLSQKVIREQDIAGEIGEVIVGRKRGRTFDREVNLSGSTGVALQDSATIPLECERWPQK